MRYLSVTNLHKFQHYKHRNPPWVKLYREFWTDYTLRSCPISTRLLFMGCLSLASELENAIPGDPRYLTDRLGFKVSESDILTLLSSTLLYSTLREHLASAVLAECTHNASMTQKLLNGRDYRDEAKVILQFLNEKTGRHYREVDVTLTLIEARLKSGVDLQTCKSLIARKVRDWTPDVKMSSYLRPETLFNKSKFETYLAEVTP